MTTSPLQIAREEAIQGRTPEPLHSPDRLRAFHAYLKQAVAPRGFIALAEEAPRASVSDSAPLAASATTEPLVSPRSRTSTQKLVPEAKVFMIERSSHFAHVDTPGAVVDAALSFFDAQVRLADLSRLHAPIRRDIDAAVCLA